MGNHRGIQMEVWIILFVFAKCANCADMMLYLNRTSEEVLAHNQYTNVSPYNLYFQCSSTDHSLAFHRLPVLLKESDVDNELELMKNCYDAQLRKNDMCIVGWQDAIDAVQKQNVSIMFIGNYHWWNVEFFLHLETQDEYFSITPYTFREKGSERLFLSGEQFERVACIPLVQFLFTKLAGTGTRLIPYESCLCDHIDYVHLRGEQYVFGKRRPLEITAVVPRPVQSYNCNKHKFLEALIWFTDRVYDEEQIKIMRRLGECMNGRRIHVCAFGLEEVVKALNRGWVTTIVVKELTTIRTEVFINSITGEEIFIHGQTSAESLGEDIYVKGTKHYFRECTPFIIWIRKNFNGTIRVLSNKLCTRGFNDANFLTIADGIGALMKRKKI